jgi:hypothetical protein
MSTAPSASQATAAAPRGELPALFTEAHGTFRSDARASVFTMVKDERYYLRAFYDHHRRLGVDQFIVLDDYSSDGTREWLAAQPDTVVLESPYKFGQRATDPVSGVTHRADILFKTAIPQRYLPGRYGLYLDADEFLVLPPGIASVPQLLELLARHDVRSVVAHMVDFFPETVHEMDRDKDLPTAADMLGAYGWFDGIPLLGWKRGADQPVEVGENASTRLFRKHRVKAVPTKMLGAPRWLNRLLPYRYPETTVIKTPVVRWDRGVTYTNSHYANVVPTHEVMLGLAHLKFTHDLSRRTRYALESQSYVRGSRKYQWYEELLESMRHGDPSFLGPKSRHFQSAEDFAAVGLTQLDLR